MIRLDANIGKSYYRKLILFGLMAIIAVLGLRLGLVWWHYGLLLVILGFLLWSDAYRVRIVHLVSPVGCDKIWQCKVETLQGEELWQAELLEAYDYGLCMALTMAIKEPKQEKVRWLIFADMMDKDDFRRLKLLTAFMTH